MKRKKDRMLVFHDLKTGSKVVAGKMYKLILHKVQMFKKFTLLKGKLNVEKKGSLNGDKRKC